MVREGLRLLQQREREADEALGVFKAKLKQACDQADQGQLVDGETVFAKVDALIDRRREGSDIRAK